MPSINDTEMKDKELIEKYNAHLGEQVRSVNHLGEPYIQTIYYPRGVSVVHAVSFRITEEDYTEENWYGFDTELHTTNVYAMFSDGQERRVVGLLGNEVDFCKKYVDFAKINNKFILCENGMVVPEIEFSSMENVISGNARVGLC